MNSFIKILNFLTNWFNHVNQLTLINIDSTKLQAGIWGGYLV